MLECLAVFFSPLKIDVYPKNMNNNNKNMKKEEEEKKEKEEKCPFLGFFSPFFICFSGFQD